jgi:hypothetical protein
MKLQKQPNLWSCLPTSFAMAMNMEVEKLIQLIGHDGSEILFPDLEDPNGRKNFSPHEIILVALKLKYYVTSIPQEGILVYASNDDLIHHEELYKLSEEDLFTIMSTNSGVLTGENYHGRRHAVAWDGHMIHDPNGYKYTRDRFLMDIFWAVGEIK